ncbi:MAG: hypothetical protein A2V70_07615 [Planctomycetes bacterium RBG_13_63_9]|nr:MAG: hypothetical protein A2V70_07615 [Planctomycetes bacterium RBG_13_63_9]
MGNQHKHSHEHPCGCCLSMGRRDFMTTVGLSALAAKSAVMGLASPVTAGEPRPSGKPRVRAVFVRPNVERYWMGWPGASYDIKARQADYTKRMTDAAAKLGIDLEVTAEPLSDRGAISALIEQCATSPPDGVILTIMDLNASWAETDRFVAERPPEIPTIVFSPMGTSFTGHLQKTRNQPKTLVAATQDLEWLAEGLHLMRTIYDMKNTRICIVNGDKTQDEPLAVIGTTLHHIPLERWVEEFGKAETNDEMKALADQFTKRAKKIVEPNAQDVFNSAKNYVVAKRIMAAENCQGISLNCLGLIGARRIPCPPCMAWLQLNDEGGVGACECDWGAAISLRLCALLCRRPGFMQDPCPNTINGTLMGAHCSSPTKLRGFDQDPEPLILRNHSESTLGVSPQVIWPVGEPATVMKFSSPDNMLIGTGRVVANIDTPPAGGCRTSVELAMDGVADPRDCKGFHQLFVLGRVDAQLKNYCQLAGITVTPV